MIARPCISCGEPIATGTYCTECTPVDHRVRHAIRSNPSRWKKLSAKARKLQPWCSTCGTSGDLTADHIIPIVERPDLAYVIENIDILCRPCNGRKAGAPPSDAERLAVEQRLESARLRRIRAARTLADQGETPSDLRVPPLVKAKFALHFGSECKPDGGDAA